VDVSSAQEKPPETQRPPPESTSKKRVRAHTPETREIAIARVTALTKAGNQRKTSIETVSKELGVSYGAINKWIIGWRKSGGAEVAKKKAQRKPKREVKATGLAEFIRANPEVGALELVNLGKKQGLKFTRQYVYTVRSAGKVGIKGRRPAAANGTSRVQASDGSKSIGDLLDQMIDAASEIRRRLSQLSL